MEHIILAIGADTEGPFALRTNSDTTYNDAVIFLLTVVLVVFSILSIIRMREKRWSELRVFIILFTVFIIAFTALNYFTNEFLKDEVNYTHHHKQNNLDKRDTSINNNMNTENINIPWGVIGQIALLILLSVIVLALIVLTLSYVVKKVKQYNVSKKHRLSVVEYNNKEWNNLQDRYDKIMFLYADAESSPETVIYRPIILSTSYSLTRDFHNNKEIAFNNLESRIDLDKCSESVKTLENTWYNLYETAENVGLPGVNIADKRRAVNLLRMVQDESYGVPERSNALSKLKNILDKIEFSLKEKNNIFDKLMFNIELSTNVRLELT